MKKKIHICIYLCIYFACVPSVHIGSLRLSAQDDTDLQGTTQPDLGSMGSRIKARNKVIGQNKQVDVENT